MQELRAFLYGHRWLAAVLLLAALFLKMAVPAGYMVPAHSKTLTIQICQPALDGEAAHKIVVPM